jgi:hypothetical protein
MSDGSARLPISFGARIEGAHGAFDARARSWSPQLWTSEHRAWLTLGAIALMISGLIALFKNKEL